MPNDHSLMFVPSLLKPEMVKAIEAMDMTAQQIADRWVSGWAAETLAQEASGDLLPQLRAQAEKENEVYLQMQPGGRTSIWHGTRQRRGSTWLGGRNRPDRSPRDRQLLEDEKRSGQWTRNV